MYDILCGLDYYGIDTNDETLIPPLLDLIMNLYNAWKQEQTTKYLKTILNERIELHDYIYVNYIEGRNYKEFHQKLLKIIT